MQHRNPVLIFVTTAVLKQVSQVNSYKINNAKFGVYQFKIQADKFCTYFECIFKIKGKVFRNDKRYEMFLF